MNRHEIKRKRLETTYQQIISEAILFHIDDKRIKPGSVTITRVRVNQDLSEAEIYFSCMENDNPNKLVKSLYSAESLFLAILKNRVKIKYLPRMKFRYDKELKEAGEVVALIDELAEEYKKKS